jgi:tetratricopeptide (TPR) repeat protein
MTSMEMGPHDATEIPAIELPRHAQSALAAGQLDRYGWLFGRAQEIADPQRRYWAAKRLIECGLMFDAGAAGLDPSLLFAAVAVGAVEALEREPREPLLLEYAGVALCELWSFDVAEAMFEAVARLDPERSLETNMAELRRRRALGREVKRALAPAVPDRALASRAIEVAGRAHPAPGLRLSLCMIVRDEEEMLPRCLAAVADAVDEIIVVDTGSSDRTVEIAESFGAAVRHHEWTGSFADARNVSLDLASGDWFVYLDADEVLVGEDAAKLRALAGRTWREAFYLSETNYTGDMEDGTAVTHNALRMYRNRPGYRFVGRLHEQIAQCLPGYLPERLEATDVRVEHYGYLGAVRDSREKSRRNIELLRLQQEEGPPTAFLHYNLGSEYAAAGEPQQALSEFQQAWSLLQSLPDRNSYQFGPALTSRLVKALRACSRHEQAIERAQEGLGLYPGFTDLVMEQGLAAAALGRGESAIECFERCLEMGDAPSQYTATVGCGTYLAMFHLAECRRERGELRVARELLERCLREHPHFLGAVLPYASALLADGIDAETTLGEFERNVPDPSPSARFMLGTALYENGAAAVGESQFRAVLRSQPSSGRARVALGETLLAQRRYAEAASEVQRIDPADPLAAMAARTECFASILAGGRDLQAVLARARTVGLPAHELELFGTWSLAALGQGVDSRLDGAAAGLAIVMLEALLRVQDFQSFEVLLGVFEAVELEPRERREMLADMYLRRGYAASAAEEWMAVCQADPDARALVGLARVAAVRGMTTEVSDFAKAALRHDPDNAMATKLLAAIR